MVIAKNVDTCERRSQRKKYFAFFVFAIFVLFTLSRPATSGERFALVLAGADYAAIGDLENPIHDANAVSRALAEAAFKVTTLTNPTYSDAVAEVATFIARLEVISQTSKIEAVLFYFAGHALQHRAANFLLPVDFSFEKVDDSNEEPEAAFKSLMLFEAALEKRALNVDDIIATFNGVDAENYMFIFDSCRSSPIEGLVRGQGLAEIDAGPNNYVVFAAKPGAVALDGTNGNSPFSRALASRIPYQGIPIEVTIQGVRRDVFYETNGFQLPWDASSLMYPFSFVPLGVFGQREPIANISEQERALWQFVHDTNYSATALRRYLLLFPKGLYAKEARVRLEDSN